MHGITLCIPGGDVISLRHLVLDYNGTLAAVGKLLPGDAERSGKTDIYPEAR